MNISFDIYIYLTFRLQDIFSELGCKIIKIVNTSVATLETPITKPKLKDTLAFGSNRKRKRTTT